MGYVLQRALVISMISTGHVTIILVLVILSCYEATEQCETVIAVVGIQNKDRGLATIITLGRDGFRYYIVSSKCHLGVFFYALKVMTQLDCGLYNFHAYQ